MSEFNCRAIGSNATEVPGITVGDLFRIRCEQKEAQNSSGVVLDPQSYLKVDKDKYTVKIIDSTQGTVNAATSNTSFELLVTSYRVGDHNIPTAELVTNQGIHTLTGIHFKVESILNPQQPSKEPFGPAGPFSLKLPMMYWIVLAAVIGVVLLISIVVGVLKRQRQKLIAKLKEKDSSLSPYHQINAKLRQMMREFAFFSTGKLTKEDGIQIVHKLDEFFKLYLTREFYIPAFDWGPKTIQRDFKKRQKGLAVYAANDLSLIMRELAKAKDIESTEGLSFKDSDITHLIKSIRTFVDKIEDLKAKGFDKLDKTKRRFQ